MQDIFSIGRPGPAKKSPKQRPAHFEDQMREWINQHGAGVGPPTTWSAMPLVDARSLYRKGDLWHQQEACSDMRSASLLPRASQATVNGCHTDGNIEVLPWDSPRSVDPWLCLETGDPFNPSNWQLVEITSFEKQSSLTHSQVRFHVRGWECNPAE